MCRQFIITRDELKAHYVIVRVIWYLTTLTLIELLSFGVNWHAHSIFLSFAIMNRLHYLNFSDARRVSSQWPLYSLHLPAPFLTTAAALLNIHIPRRNKQYSLTRVGEPRWTSFPCQNLRVKCLTNPTCVLMKSKPGFHTKLPYPKTQTGPSTFDSLHVSVITKKGMDYQMEMLTVVSRRTGEEECLFLSAGTSVSGVDEKSAHISWRNFLPFHFRSWARMAQASASWIPNPSFFQDQIKMSWFEWYESRTRRAWLAGSKCGTQEFEYLNTGFWSTYSVSNQQTEASLVSLKLLHDIASDLDAWIVPHRLRISFLPLPRLRSFHILSLHRWLIFLSHVFDGICMFDAMMLIRAPV